MILLALLASALAAPFAGVPVAVLPSLAVGEPVFINASDSWRAALPGGFVLLQWHATEEEAKASFGFQLSTIQARLPEATLVGFDEARGDEQMVVARKGNIVFVARSDEAKLAVSRLGSALVTEPALAPPFVPALGELAPEEPRDAFGRRQSR